MELSVGPIGRESSSPGQRRLRRTFHERVGHSGFVRIPPESGLRWSDSPEVLHGKIFLVGGGVGVLSRLAGSAALRTAT
ncbi:MAG: hypothetical protein RJA70_2539 [Pseudomonadota bacterium]|jgi:hypothetical protein